MRIAITIVFLFLVSVVRSADTTWVSIGSDYTIQANVSGGIAPFQYIWSCGGSGSSITFTSITNTINCDVLLVDSIGCEVSDTFVLVPISTLVSPIDSQFICPGDTLVLPVDISNRIPYDSIVYTNVTGSYSCSCDTVEVSASGTTYIDVYSNCGILRDSFYVHMRDSISVDIEFYECDSAYLVADITGGQPPYLTFWSTGAVGDTLTIDTSGVFLFTVNVVDANGCTASKSRAISVGGSIAIQPLSDVILCDTSFVNILITNNSVSDSLFVYGADTTKCYGCSSLIDTITQVGEYIVEAFSACKVYRDTFEARRAEIDYTIVDASCNNLGVITIDTINADAPQFLSWSTGRLDTFVGRPISYAVDSGTYSVTVCDTTFSFYVGKTNSLAVSGIVSNAVCGLNGGVNITAGGGGGYVYQWSNGATSEDLSGVAPGLYTVVVTSGGCSISEAFTIPDSDDLSISAQVTNAICGSGGRIDVTPAGGIGSYSYQWSNGLSTQDINNLLPGNYTLTMTSGTCTESRTFAVGNTGSIAVSAGPDWSICPGQTIQLQATSSTSGVSYSWSPTTGLSNPTIANPLLTLSSSNVYVYTVTATIGSCTGSDDVIVSVNNVATSAGSISGIQSGCAPFNPTTLFSTSSGSACASYQWQQNNGNGWFDISGATAANYDPSSLNQTTQFRRAAYCSCGGRVYSNIIQISISPAPVSSFFASSVCQGDPITLMASLLSGGVAPYTYSIFHTSSGTPLITQTTFSSSFSYTDPVVKTFGSYVLRVTDANGCSATQRFLTPNISAPPSVSTGGTQNVCSDNLPTSISGISVFGGSGPYTYSWSSPLGVVLGNTSSSSPTILAASNGSYNLILTVTGGNGCSTTVTKRIDVITCVDCNCSASISLNNCSIVWSLSGSGCSNFTPYMALRSTSGCTGGYSLTPLNGTSGVFTPTTNGFYYNLRLLSNTCTDRNSNCVRYVKPTVNAGPNQTICNDGNSVQLTGASVSGGTGPYNINWSVPSGINISNTSSLFPSITATSPGTYTLTLTITDSNGCSDSDTKTVSVLSTGNTQIVNTTPSQDFCDDNIVSFALTNTTGISGVSWSVSGGIITQNTNSGISVNPNSTSTSFNLTVIANITWNNGCTSRVTNTFCMPSCVTAFKYVNQESVNGSWRLVRYYITPQNNIALRQVACTSFPVAEIAHQSGSFYYTIDGSSLKRFNENTCSSTTICSVTPSSYQAIAKEGFNTILALTGTQIYRINTSNCAATLLHDFSSSGIIFSGIEYKSSDGITLVSRNGIIYRIVGGNPQAQTISGLFGENARAIVRSVGSNAYYIFGTQNVYRYTNGSTSLAQIGNLLGINGFDATYGSGSVIVPGPYCGTPLGNDERRKVTEDKHSDGVSFVLWSILLIIIGLLYVGFRRFFSRD